MRRPRFDPRRLARFVPGLMAFALLLCLCGAAATPVSAASVEPTVLTAGANTGIVDAILDVFSKIGEWLSSAVPTFMPMFYSADSGLTFLGVLAVAGLGFSVVFLCIGIIQRFLHFRG